MPKKESVYYTDTNGVPKDLDGRVTHLGLKRGELAPRVVTVGSFSRAQRLRACLDNPDTCFERASARGFTTYTGTYKGTPVSIVSTGMGAAMMDFLVRESRAVTDGPMLIVRFGSCGGLLERARPGTVILNTLGSVWLHRDPDTFLNDGCGVCAGLVPRGPAYRLTRPVAPDAKLNAVLGEQLRAALGNRVLEGLNVSSDSFYASQGRIDAQFEDRNDDLVAGVVSRHPNATSMEMETFHLLHLASCSRGTVRACAASICAANRVSTDVVSTERLYELETAGGRAVLRAITSTPLSD